MKATILLFIAIALILPSQALYFFLTKGAQRCFKDELINDSEVQIRVNILNDEVERYIERFGDDSVEGIKVQVTNPKKEVVFE